MPPAPALSDHAALIQSLQRLVDVIVSENEVLRRHEAVSHSEFADRKNYALRELMAAQRGHQPSLLPDMAKKLIRELSSVLQENSRLLKLHIAALGDVSDIIIGTLREAESDGTYGKTDRYAKT